jgi:hypothetical protein
MMTNVDEQPGGTHASIRGARRGHQLGIVAARNTVRAVERLDEFANFEDALCANSQS